MSLKDLCLFLAIAEHQKIVAAKLKWLNVLSVAKAAYNTPTLFLYC